MSTTCPLHYCTPPAHASPAVAAVAAEHESVQPECARIAGTVAVVGVAAVQHIAGDKLQPTVVPEHVPEVATPVAERWPGVE